MSIHIIDGRWKCHGCGKQGNGLTFADLKGIKRESVPGWESRPRTSTIVERYPYVDESGNLLYESVRFEPKKFKQRRPVGKGGWSWDLNGIRRVPYRLPELLSAPKDTVFIVEGEKDVDTLRKLGITATCNPMGAGKWREEYGGFLKGFLQVVIIADKDDSGRSHAQEVAASVSKVVGRIKVMEVPGDWVKDAADYFEAGGTVKDLFDLAQGTPQWTPPINCAQPRESVSCGIKFAPKPLFQLMNEKPPEREWLVERYLAKGSLAILAGHPKHGKSTLVYWLIKCVMTGKDFLGFITERAKILVLAVEESLEDITDRFIKEQITEDTQLFIHCAPLRASDVEMEGIRDFIKTNGIGLVVVDTLARFWKVKDESNASEVSTATQPLLELARETGAAVVLVHHSRKSEGEDGTEIRGSGDILAVADIGLILKKRKGSETQRTLYAHSRYSTPKELVISYENGEYLAIGSASHVRHEEQRKKVLSCLSMEFKYAEDVAEMAELSSGTCRTVLNDLYGEGRIDRQGEGKRGKAFSYALKSEINSAQNQTLGACAIIQSPKAPDSNDLPGMVDPIQAVFPGAKVREVV